MKKKKTLYILHLSDATLTKEKNSTDVLHEKSPKSACWAAVRKLLAQNESQVALLSILKMQATPAETGVTRL